MPRLRIIVFFGCIIVFLTLCVTKGDAGAETSYNSARYYRQIRGNAYYNGEPGDYARVPGQQTTSNMKPQIKKALSGSGLSAWGIIAIILSVIFIGFAIYYTYLLYPIFCKKERQYNNIELVAV